MLLMGECKGCNGLGLEVHASEGEHIYRALKLFSFGGLHLSRESLVW
jgi:hypothetical protein